MGGLPVSELNNLELQFLKLNNFKLNVQVEELQQYGNQLLWHWIREHRHSNNIKKQQPKSCLYNNDNHKIYKKEDYQPIIRYTTDHRSNKNNNNSNTNHMLSNNNNNNNNDNNGKIRTCSSNVLLFNNNDKSVSEKYDTITRC